jgi:hypothetical protein
MGCHRKTRRSPARIAAKPTRRLYQHGLVEAIGRWFPGQFFSRWAVTRGTKWSPQRLFWMAILMTWSAEQTLQTRFEAVREVLRELFPKWPLGTTYTGWYQALARWLPTLRPAVTQRFQRHVHGLAGKWWQREGWCAFAADGSRIACPRTAANERALGCAGRKRTGPQLFVTTLWHMGTGLPWDFRIGPGTDSERRHVEAMLPALPPRALVVADAGFTGYDFYQRILAARQHFLLRVGANVQLLRKLGYVEHEGRDLVYVWPQKRRNQPPVVLRLIRLGTGKKTVYLVTNVLDEAALSLTSATVLYELRWGVEVFYRSLKQTLRRRQMLSHTPVAAECELTWTVYGLWLLALLSVAKITARGAEPLSWSAALARNRVRRSLRLALTGRHQDRALGYDLARTVQDTYVRTGSKKARNWPHKKNDPPPGAPKILTATAAQRHAVQRLKAKKVAA